MVRTVKDFGIPLGDIKEIIGGEAEQNARILQAVLDGEKGARRNAVILNAAAVVAAAGLADDLKAGVAIAADAIDSGKAKKKLDELIKCSNA